MTSIETNYDYIILGAGGAGLSLAYRFVKNPFFQDKNVLVLDKNEKNKNDRTWSFWEKGQGVFQEVVHKEWSSFYFHSHLLTKKLDISPFKYKMIRGVDFYNYTIKAIEASDNVTLRIDPILEIKEEPGRVEIVSEKHSYYSPVIFKSYPSSDIDKTNYHYVDQHFKGWNIKTEKPVFPIDTATFMDFRIEQNGEERFLYVLPVSPYEALVEVAIFSNNLLSQQAYDQILRGYIQDFLNIQNYKIVDKEYGVIPMTDYPFWKDDTHRICHIGTGGGVVKPSSGYAFTRIQKHSDLVIDYLKSGKKPQNANKFLKNRHLLYDRTLLNVMLNKEVSGEKIFSDIFKRSDISTVLKFLDGDTNIIEETNVFKAPPMFAFMKAFFKEWVKK